MTFDAKEKSVYGGAPVECYRFLHGATEYLNTSADAAQTIGSKVYTPETIRRTQIDQSQEDQAGGIDVTVPRTHPVALLFVAYLPVAPVTLTISRFHRGDSEVVTAFVGTVASVAFSGDEAVLRCLPITEVFRRRIPTATYQVQCNHALYSTACGVNKATYKVTGTITAVSGDTITAVEWDALADGYFNGGYIETATGEVRFIVGHVGGVLTIMAPVQGLGVGDVVHAYPGCAHTEAACFSKFNNIANHLGFARVPKRNVFDGGV